MNLNKFRYRKGTLSNELATPLLELGYKLDSLMYLIKVNPFSEVEEALNYMSRDPDTHKYNHYFYNPNNINTKNGFNINKKNAIFILEIIVVFNVINLENGEHASKC